VACAPLAACSTTGDGAYEPESEPGYLAWALEHESLERVRPWERDLLAREDMAWEPDPLAALRRAHILFSKEASLVGGTAGGGGCGCN
jgi:hypothetical protein